MPSCSTLFLDCEFTCLEAPSLLSLGLSDAVGKNEFYGELAVSTLGGEGLNSQVSTFVHANVLPQFGRIQAVQSSTFTLGLALAAWLDKWTGYLDIAYDYHADFDLLEAALSEVGAWERMRCRLVPVHVGYLWGVEEAHQAAEHSWRHTFMQSKVGRHHALADARALAAAFEAVHG